MRTTCPPHTCSHSSTPILSTLHPETNYYHSSYYRLTGSPRLTFGKSLINLDRCTMQSVRDFYSSTSFVHEIKLMACCCLYEYWYDV